MQPNYRLRTETFLRYAGVVTRSDDEVYAKDARVLLQRSLAAIEGTLSAHRRDDYGNCACCTGAIDVVPAHGRRRRAVEVAVCFPCPTRKAIERALGDVTR